MDAESDNFGMPARLEAEAMEQYMSRCLAISRAQTRLSNLIAELPHPVLDFTPSIPAEVQVFDDVIQKVAQRVTALSAAVATTDRSGSIDKRNSIHHLWDFVINQLQANRPGSELNRVLHDWILPSPMSAEPKHAKAINFTIVPAALAHLNWLDYRGGLVLLDPAWSGHASSPDSMTAASLLQALSRCAMCVASRWKKSGWRGDHCAYCCYADACTLGVTRVRLVDNISDSAPSPFLVTLARGIPPPSVSSHISSLPPKRRCRSCYLPHRN